MAASCNQAVPAHKQQVVPLNWAHSRRRALHPFTFLRTVKSMMPDSVHPATGKAPANSRTARSIAWNYAGYAYQIGINIGLTSYIVRRISVAEYGLLLFVMSLSATLYLLDLGISSVLVQAYVEASASAGKDRLNDLLSTTFLSLTALGSIGVLIFSGLAISLPGPFNIPHPYLHEASAIFLLAGLVIQFGLPGIAIEHVFLSSSRFDRTNQVQLVTCTVQMVLSVLALAAGYRIVALAIIQLITVLLRFLLLAFALPASVPGARLSIARFNRELLKPLVRLSKWAFLSNLSTYLFDMLVWLILGSLGSMQEAALFGLASKAPKQLWNLVDKGANVTLPLLSQLSAENDPVHLRQMYLKTQKLIFGAVVPFIVLGCLFARPIIQVWAGSQYVGAAVVMRWLLVAAFSHAIAYSSDLLLYACGEVKRAATISLWSSAISILAALLLVSRFGAAGIAAGVALAQLLVNCTWYTVAACRLSGTSAAELFRVLFDGLPWPLAALAAEIAVISSISARLSSLWLLVAALAGGLTYITIWGTRTALPIYRDYREAVA